MDQLLCSTKSLPHVSSLRWVLRVLVLRLDGERDSRGKRVICNRLENAHTCILRSTTYCSYITNVLSVVYLFRFFRLSLGGACIGVAFGLGLLIILYSLNRRLNNEDAIVQVVATITASYLAFFTSEILCKCSGISK